MIHERCPPATALLGRRLRGTFPALPTPTFRSCKPFEKLTTQRHTDALRRDRDPGRFLGWCDSTSSFSEALRPFPPLGNSHPSHSRSDSSVCHGLPPKVKDGTTNADD
jgi:hypothetical protein